MLFNSIKIPEAHKKVSKALMDLATDLRWTWSHFGDALWKTIDLDTWQATRNPYAVIQNLSLRRLQDLLSDKRFISRLNEAVKARRKYLERECWADSVFDDTEQKMIAYFSMEFGLGNALPLYAGGLGILAGDHLKAASDLGLPLVGIGLLYDEGYFRQVIDTNGWQNEINCFNDSRNLPLQPVLDTNGAWLAIELKFPGRVVRLQVWRAKVGRVDLYLLDSNDPRNHPLDQGITGPLYGGSQELRLTQEIALGIGGWRLIEALGLPVSICHLNEGHAAFAALERARFYSKKTDVDFWHALSATRPGNIFTTHTPVPSAFDTYPLELLTRYGQDYARNLGIAEEELLGLGRAEKTNTAEPFNMAYLAARTCGRMNGVSQLHGEVSRKLFSVLYPRWPIEEIPITHITNGVHVPTWDSPRSDKVWTEACGKSRWLGEIEPLHNAIMKLSDKEIWTFRCEEREDLVRYVRKRVTRQLAHHVDNNFLSLSIDQILDPNTLTLGFARRFTQYKRPDLLLYDQDRLTQLLSNTEAPIQIIVAGKAHPRDEWGKACIQAWVNFCKRPEIVGRAVFIEDYDMALALELVQGVDVWINTPERPWEACGTSGMKVLANGGINLSALDGWWAEAYKPEYGWAIGNESAASLEEKNRHQSDELYTLIEDEIIPSFYSKNEKGMPIHWISRIRRSMANLAPQFSSNRMVRQYARELYLPAQLEFNRRSAKGSKDDQEITRWKKNLDDNWNDIHWGKFRIYQDEKMIRFEVQVYLAGVSPRDVKVQIFSEFQDGNGKLIKKDMQLNEGGADPLNYHLYTLNLSSEHPVTSYTPRILPYHPHIKVPLELNLIRWWEGEKEVIQSSSLGFWEAV